MCIRDSQMGASGAMIIGITAAIIAVGYLINNFDDLGDSSYSAGKNIAEAFGAESSNLIGVQLLASIIQDAGSNTEAMTWATEELKKKGWDPAKQSLIDFVDLQEKSLKLSAAQTALSKLTGDLMSENIQLQFGISAAKGGGKFDFEDWALAIENLKADPLRFLKGAITGETEQETAAAIIKKNESAITNHIDYVKDYVNNLFGDGGFLSFLMTGGKGGKGGKGGGSDYYSKEVGKIKHLVNIQKIYGATKLEGLEMEFNMLQKLDQSKLTDDQIVQWQRRLEVLQALMSQLEGVTVTGKKVSEEIDKIGQALQPRQTHPTMSLIHI